MKMEMILPTQVTLNESKKNNENIKLSLSMEKN